MKLALMSPFAIYESVVEENEFDGLEVVKSLDEFKQKSDVIVANRLDDKIKDVRNKVYTRICLVGISIEINQLV